MRRPTSVDRARYLPGVVLCREHGTADKFVLDTGVENERNVIAACVPSGRAVSPNKRKAIARLADELSALKRGFKMELAKLETRQNILFSDHQNACQTFNRNMRSIVSRLEAIHKGR